jgi:prepilin-type processing-associated H-X9-DG protein
MNRVSITGCLLGLACLTLPLFAMLARQQTRTASERKACLENIHSHSVALIQYAHDYDDRLPENLWMERSREYLSEAALHCPALSEHEFGYAFRAGLLDQSLEKISRPEKAILTLESTSRTKNALSVGWDFSTRHDGLGSASFADGHVAELTRQQFDALLKPSP